MRRSILFFALIFIYTFSSAQEIQWASEVISYSSQKGNEEYAAKQIVGVPNAMTEGTVAHWAWAPKKDEVNTLEFIRVKFLEQIQVSQVIIAESKNPGAISKIVLYDTDNKKHTVYENENPEPYKDEPRRLFTVDFDKTDYKVKLLRLELKTGRVMGSNQIDAIGVSGSSKPVSIEVDEIEYEEEVAEKENLGKKVNSRYAERLPVISPDGKTLYMARKYHPLNEGEDKNDDIWVSKLEADGTWGFAKPIHNPLNTENHDFVVSVNPTGDVLYLGTDYRKSVKDGVSTSKNKRGAWTDPKPLKIEDHKNESLWASYHVNTDENILLMAVEREDGMGKRDLYVSFKGSNNQWSQPKNLGKTINTVNEESSVFLAADGKTIYFSSAGHLGYGGLDMFMSRRLDESWTKWSKPKNLGKKINTLGNDYSYSIPASGNYAYFASDDEHGMSDIFRIRLPKEVQPDPVVLLSGRMIDAETNRPIKAKLKTRNIKNKKNKRATDSSTEGDYTIVVPYGEDVALTAEVDGYFAPSENLELSGKRLKELDSDKGVKRTNDDPALDDMQEKLDRLNSDLKDLRVQKNKKQKPVKTTPSKKRNAELEALRAKYNKATGNQESVPEEYPNDDDLEVKTKDKELEELKRKYRERYNKDKKPRVDSPKPRVDKKEKEEIEVAENGDINLNELETKVRKDLENELSAAIKYEIQDDVIDDVVKLLEKELVDEVEILGDDKVKDIIEDYRTDLAKELRKEKRDAEKRTTSDNEVLNTIEEEYREALKPEIREQLKTSIPAALKKEVGYELEYRYKRASERQLKEALEEKQQEAEVVEEIPEPEQEEEPPLVKEYKEVKKDILLVPIKVGQVIPLNNIFFDANKTTLKPISDVELERVTKFLSDNKNVIVEVGGHTNGWCSSEFADELSTERAKVVCSYFIEKGISVDQVLYRGYGKTEPIADNDTLAGRKKNQRVELIIMEVK